MLVFTAFKAFELVVECKEHYEKIQHRYNFLIIISGAKMGKTEYANAFFGSPYVHKSIRSESIRSRLKSSFM